MFPGASAPVHAGRDSGGERGAAGGGPTVDESPRVSPDLSALADADIARRGDAGLETPPRVRGDHGGGGGVTLAHAGGGMGHWPGQASGAVVHAGVSAGPGFAPSEHGAGAPAGH